MHTCEYTGPPRVKKTFKYLTENILFMPRFCNPVLAYCPGALSDFFNLYRAQAQVQVIVAHYNNTHISMSGDQPVEFPVSRPLGLGPVVVYDNITLL